MNNLIDRLIAEGAIFTDSARELLEKEILNSYRGETPSWTPQQLWVGGEGGDV